MPHPFPAYVASQLKNSIPFRKKFGFIGESTVELGAVQVMQDAALCLGASIGINDPNGAQKAIDSNSGAIYWTGIGINDDDPIKFIRELIETPHYVEMFGKWSWSNNLLRTYKVLPNYPFNHDPNFPFGNPLLQINESNAQIIVEESLVIGLALGIVDKDKSIKLIGEWAAQDKVETKVGSTFIQPPPIYSVEQSIDMAMNVFKSWEMY